MGFSSRLIFLTVNLFLLSEVLSFLGLPLLTCYPTCLTCSGPNSSDCTSCLTGLLMIAGACDCAAGKYYASALTACQNCNAACATCNGPSSSNCLTCPTNYQVYQGTCYPACTSTQYFNTATLSCAACNTYCQTCNGGASNQCTSCTMATLTSGTCVCPAGQYVTPLGGCANCDSTCKTCSGNLATQCTSCITGMMLQSGRCVCPTGYYQTLSPLGCQTCNSACLGCSGPTANDCTSCKNNLVLSSGQCLCPASTYYNAATFSCLACSSLCSSCTGPNSNQCTGCKNNLVLSSGQCTCPSGTYLDTTIFTCRSCDSTCQECSGPSSTECTACSGTLSLSASGQCVCSGLCSCPSGLYFDSGLQTCLQCDPTCVACTGPTSTECSSCRSDFTQSGSNCNCPSPPCTCPAGSYYDTFSSSCKKCNSICQTCTGPTSNECQTCINGLIVSSGSCGCPAGTYLHSSNFCFACDATCDSCTGPNPTDCTTCKSGLISSGGVCVCPTGQYFDSGSKTCSGCNSDCQSCSGPEKSQCLTCLTGKVLFSGYCIEVCSSNQYRSTDNSCQPCDSTCLTCSGGGSNNCTSCLSPRVFSNGSCPDVSTSGCYFKCSTCLSSSSSDCLTCNTGLALVEIAQSFGYCEDRCPVGYYIVRNGSQVKCRPKIRLNNKLGYGYELNELELIYGQDIGPFLDELKNSIEIAIEFRVDQPPINYTYSLYLTAKNQNLMLNLTFFGHLLPRNILHITYNLPTGDSDDNISSIYVVKQTHAIRLIEFYNHTPGMWAFVDAVSTINSVGAQANGVFSWTSSLILRSVHGLRSETVEDMIGYFIFMNIDFPPNFIKFAKDSLNSFEIIMPNLFNPLINDDQNGGSRLLQNQYNNNKDFVDSEHRKSLIRIKHPSRLLLSEDAEVIMNMRLDSRDFLQNHGAATSLMLIALGTIIAVEIVRFLFYNAKNLPRIRKIIKVVSCSLRLNFLIGHLCSEYQGFVFFSILQLTQNTKPVNRADYLNLIFGMLGFFLSTLSIISMFLIARTVTFKKKALKDARPQEKEKIETYLERVDILHQSFKDDGFIMLLYPGFLLSRCFGFGIVLIFASPWPFVQIGYLLTTSGGMLAYLFYYKPVSKISQHRLTLVYECFFMGITLLTLLLHVYNQYHIDDIETRSYFSLMILSLCTAMIILNFISLFLDILELRKKCLRKKQVAPLRVIRADSKELKSNPKISSNGSIKTHSSVSIPNMGSDLEEQPIRGLRINKNLSKRPNMRRDSSDDESMNANQKKGEREDLTDRTKKQEEASSALMGFNEEGLQLKKETSSQLFEQDNLERKSMNYVRMKDTIDSKDVSEIPSSLKATFGKRLGLDERKKSELFSLVSDTSEISLKDQSPSKEDAVSNKISNQDRDVKTVQISENQNQKKSSRVFFSEEEPKKFSGLTLYDLERAESLANRKTFADKVSRGNQYLNLQKTKFIEKPKEDLKMLSMVVEENRHPASTLLTPTAMQRNMSVTMEMSFEGRKSGVCNPLQVPRSSGEEK